MLGMSFMQETSSRNKRIAKNTMLLYFRMLFTMLVSLYTSRIVLKALGVDDFGIYNVVGGLVSLFSLLSGSLSAAISRFITFELGRGNFEQLKKVFASSVLIQLLLSFLIIIVAESAGLWFLNNKMIVPEARMHTANLVFHLSVITFCVNLISVPYNAAVIAHERMSVFAYISVFECLGKLVVAFLISGTSADRLALYAILVCVMACFVRLFYGVYCKKNFEECRFHLGFDKKLFKQIFVFSSWNFIGATSSVLRDYGGNVVINLFCGPAANAARGVAVQVNTAVNSFVTNFMTAMNPQITKSYACRELEYMMSLIYIGSRFSFYLLLLISLPILINADFVLSIWLGSFPEHTVSFLRLILLFTMSESISAPLITAMLATGRIRNYQIIVGGVQLLNLPVSYLCLKNGSMPEIVFVVAILLSQTCLLARLIMLRGMIGLKSASFLKKVYFNCMLVFAVSAIFPCVLKQAVLVEETILSFVVISICSLLSCSMAVLFVGCDKSERRFFFSKISSFKQRIFK